MEKTKTIGKDYTLSQLGMFCLPAIFNELIITLLYTIDDGLFISRYVGQNALAAFSILSPVFFTHTAIASLFGGVSILASYKMGEKRDEEARSDFSCIILLMVAVGVVLGAMERIFIKQLLTLLGTTDIIYPYAEAFLKVSSLYTPLVLVSNVFMRFYVPAGKPKMELFSSVVNVSINLFFDWYFVVYRRVGMVGAAYANMISTTILTLIGIYFFSSKHSELKFGKPRSKMIPLMNDSAKYGISSFLSNVSVALGTVISNYVILRFGSEEYLAAYSIVSNIQFVFMGCYFGLLGTTSPLISYAMGEKNVEKLNKILKQTFILLNILSVVIIILFITFDRPIASLYIEESAKDLKELIVFGLRISPYSFIFFGYNVAARMIFSALGNHRISGTLTFLQEVFFSNLMVILLPMLFQIKGIWFSFLLSNILMVFVTIYTVYINRDNYGYGSSKIALMVH